MEKSIRILTVVLAAQLLLALGLNYRGTNLAAPQAEVPLLAIAPNKIDRITLEGADKAKVVLAKTDGTWRLADAGDFPANGDRVAQLLTRLSELKKGPAVAATAGARERFKVSDDAFERRITLAAGDTTLATLYLGTTPVMRHVHARTAKDDAVYVVPFATYDAPVTTDAWEDHALLQFPKDTVKRVEVDGINLQAGHTAEADGAGTNATAPDVAHSAAPAAWQAEGLPGKERIRSEAVDKLVGLLAKLEVGAVLGREERSGDGLGKPVFQASLTRDDGQRVEYRIGKAADKEEYTLKSSQRPEYFRLPAYAAKPLIAAAQRDTLVASATSDPTLTAAQTPKQ